MILKMRFLMAAATLAIASIAWSGSALADDDDFRAELKQARDEIQQLRQEVAQLKNSKAWQYQSDLKSAIDKTSSQSKDSMEKGELKIPAGWKIAPYGYFKLDMSYDDSAANNGNFVIWTNSENDKNRADDKFSVTARQTRLGTRIFAPAIGDIAVMGRVEIDFYNAMIKQENQATPMLRHAYGQLTGSDWHIIFGQTSDIISPLFPNTINYPVGWFAGNVGYRHPQLQFAKWWQCDQGSEFKIETAVSREIRQDLDGLGVDDGQDTSFPSLLGRVSYAIPMAGKKLVGGISGHFGQEEIDPVAMGDDVEVNTWSLNADLLIPISKTIELKGEVFWAENFDSYFGGVAQGVNSTTLDEIETIGAWAQIGYKPSSHWAFYSGGGIDDPTDSDLENGARSSNLFAFTNANYNFSKYLSTGLELSYWQTNYKNISKGDNFRVQHAWKLSF